MRPGGILALDIATRTGWAYAHPSEVRSRTRLERMADGAGVADKIAHGSRLIGNVQSSAGENYDRFSQWLADQITVLQPKWMVFEAPVPRGASTPGFAAARLLLGLAAIAELIGTRREMHVREAAVSTVRKHFVGFGNADKKQVVAACRSRGWNPVDDNAADALAVLDYAIACLAPASMRAVA